jgi:hypothetical protein
MSKAGDIMIVTELGRRELAQFTLEHSLDGFHSLGSSLDCNCLIGLLVVKGNADDYWKCLDEGF